MVIRFILVTAVALLLLSSCTGTAGPEHVLNMAPNVEATISPTPMLLPTPKIRIELPETAAEDVEQWPFMNIELIIMDGLTEQPIAANIHFAIRKYGETEYKDNRRDVCGYVATCRLEVPATDRVVYRIEVERAVG